MSKLLASFKADFYKYILAAVFIIVPLFPKFPLIPVPGTYVAIRFEDIILAILGLITFIRIISRPRIFFKDEIVVAILIFLGVNLISLISGIFLTKTVVPHIGLLNYLRRIEYLIPLFAVFVFFEKNKVSLELNYYIKILLIIVTVAFIYALGQRYLSFPIIITQNDTYAKGVALRWTPGSHINSTFAGHYDLAAFMVMVLPVLLSLLVLLNGKFNKMVLLFVSFAGLWLLINSLSRISQVSYLVSVFVSLFIIKKYKTLAAIILVSIIMIGASSSLNARFMRFINVYYDKIKEVGMLNFGIHYSVKAQEQILPTVKQKEVKQAATPQPVFEDRSTSIRLVVEWPRAVRAFKINPLLGTGYSSIGLATDNDFLRMLGETGILGFGAFVLIILRICKVFIGSFRFINRMPELERGFVSGIIGGLAGVFISALFIDLLEASKFATLFWFLLAYAVLLARNKINEQNI